MATTETQKKKIDGLLSYIRDYLQVRFQHASRINPSIRRVADELVWQQLAVIRQLFGETKSFGPERYIVIEILTSFDSRKKGALFSLSDQNTIFNEIVSESGRDKAQKKMEGVTINDIGSFYKAIDPSLENAVLLIQSWIWWDLPDAMDLYTLDLQLDRVTALRRYTELTPELTTHYRVEMNLPTGDLTLNDVVAYEMKRSRAVANSFLTRRDGEPGHRLIIKREAVPDASADALIVAMSQRLRAMEQVQKTGSVDQTLREHYSKTLRCEPDAVTVDRVLAAENEALAMNRALLRRMIESEGNWGEPFNYKERQIELVNEKLAKIEAAGKVGD